MRLKMCFARGLFEKLPDTLIKPLHIKIKSKEDLTSMINSDYDKKYTDALSDSNLMSIYTESKSFMTRHKQLNQILKDFKIDEEIITVLSNKLMSDLLIAPALKAATRGNKFNIMVREKINDLKLDKRRFTIAFEKKTESFETDEIPDWFIQDNITSRILIGMNQLDLWGGGQQLNRGFKYIFNNIDKKNIKLLAVVCNKPDIKSTNSKVFKLLKGGYEHETICFIKTLPSYIIRYFMIDQ